MDTGSASARPDVVADQRLSWSVELASDVDALYLSAQGAAPTVLFDELESLRSAAELSGGSVDCSLGGTPVRIEPFAWGKYRYCAVHELARLGFTPSQHLPVVRVQPTAVALHSLGPAATVRWVETLLDSCGVEAQLHVSRLDLHSDWQGIEFHANERHRFVTYSDRRSVYEVDEELSGLTFGRRGGDLLCRIYDKTREAHDKGHDWRPAVWGSAYDPERKVMRVEFEFRRAGLREFGVDTPAQALDQAAALWAYATNSWLSLRIETADETLTVAGRSEMEARSGLRSCERHRAGSPHPSRGAQGTAPHTAEARRHPARPRPAGDLGCGNRHREACACQRAGRGGDRAPGPPASGDQRSASADRDLRGGRSAPGARYETCGVGGGT